MFKKIIVVFSLLISILSACSSQNPIDTEPMIKPQHDIKISALHLLAGGIPISYDYLINDWSSAGTNVNYFFSNNLSHKFYADVDY